jgi:hypothetical protein
VDALSPSGLLFQVCVAAACLAASSRLRGSFMCCQVTVGKKNLSEMISKIVAALSKLPDENEYSLFFIVPDVTFFRDNLEGLKVMVGF